MKREETPNLAHMRSLRKLISQKVRVKGWLLEAMNNRTEGREKLTLGP